MHNLNVLHLNSEHYVLLPFSIYLYLYFSHSGMLVRTALTALDHNANTGRVQVKGIKNIFYFGSFLQGSTKEGNLKFELITHRDGRKW